MLLPLLRDWGGGAGTALSCCMLPFKGLSSMIVRAQGGLQ
jgi:hypothetical protein